MEKLVEIVAEENAKVGWREYADHIRKGNRDLAAKVSLAIAQRAFDLGRAESGKFGWQPDAAGCITASKPDPARDGAQPLWLGGQHYIKPPNA